MNCAENCREMVNMASTQIQVPTKEQVYNTPDPQLFPSLISPSVIHIELHISFFLSLSLCPLALLTLSFLCISSSMAAVQMLLAMVSTAYCGQSTKGHI